MANRLPPFASFFLLSLLLATPSSNSSPTFPIPINNDQLSHLQFYIHDKISSPNATAIKVAADPSGSRASTTGLHFGSVYVIDDPLTEGPDKNSKPLGRARGFYSVSSTDGSDLYFTVQIIFTDGVYTGSSVAVMGRDPITEKVRELPVVGGTGVFRLARGFAVMKTHAFDTATGDAILFVEAYILHH
ncbi:hypothetical protein IEQ34_017933 [Dendrobium chrysotoxum]|uniref:Dirigent protein n=1 Tax=Dendrobium chrysotoxum TaxID=161865 RepID=A0AAV7GCN1_DENCH|nr:hypothetical protein IEQ34_017933 [Dendrobium chrysotoxum]